MAATNLIDGRFVAAQIQSELTQRIAALQTRGVQAGLAFVRVGTLDDPDRLPPDIHIFTSSKQPWVVLPPGTPAVAEYYDRDRYWPQESLERARLLLARTRGAREASP